MSAYDSFGSWALVPLGLAAAGPVAALVGTQTAFLLAVALIVVPTALVFCSRDVRRLERRSP
jgi:hypothetical protein